MIWEFEISEASQDGPYLFNLLLYGKDLKKTRNLDTPSHPTGFAELMPFTNTTSETVLAVISAVSITGQVAGTVFKSH